MPSKLNLLEYVVSHGKKSFQERPFGPVDAAVLSQLSYLKFELVLPQRTSTLLDTMTMPARESLFSDARFGENQRKFYFEAAFSNRYQNMKISNVRSVRNESEELCFCAMVFTPEDSLPVVVFRGTDEYLIGWKEDFAMAYRCPVPSQSMSVGYLKTAVRGRKKFYICGHSKGGNLAQYSAVNSAPDIRRRVEMIYNLDGPGFAESLTDMPEYRELSGRIVKIVPQKSLVGQLLQCGDAERRVESGGAGILQHDLFKWHIDENGGFVYVKGEKGSYKALTNRLNNNISRLSADQLERFVEALFGILAEAEIDNLVDFGENWVKNSRKILSAYIGLDDDTRDVLNDTMAALLFK